MTAVNAAPADADDVTRRLVDEAGRLLVDHGVDGLSLRKLAAASGTSTMSVYTRFGGKQQLLAAMYREGFRRLGVALREAAQRRTDPLEALAEMGRGYRAAALASRSLYGLMFGPPPPGFTPSAEDLAAAAATYRPLVDAVQRCVSVGALAGDPERIALHLWAVAHGMVGFELAARMPVDATSAAVTYDEALIFAALPFLAAGNLGRQG